MRQATNESFPFPASNAADLPEALGRGAAADGEEWRVHFHVPIFVAELPDFARSRASISASKASFRYIPAT